MVSIWVSYFFLYNVFQYAFQHISRFFGSKFNERNRHSYLDDKGPLGVGISRNGSFTVGSTVRIRILQRYAYLDNFRICHYDFVQAAFMVRLLSYGDNDTAYLQSKK